MKTTTTPAIKTYPDCYLHVRDCKSGQEWIKPLSEHDVLVLDNQLVRWIAEQFGGELLLDGETTPKLEGDYYGRIMTDGRPPESVICWDGGGFYLKPSFVG